MNKGHGKGMELWTCEKSFKPHECVGDLIEWAGGIDCEYYWKVDFSQA